jgi:hypothetical protein
MATSQIEQYRIAFDKMSLAQKKSFIDRLQKQIQGKNLPAYTKFLAECVQKYNVEARGGNSIEKAFVSPHNQTRVPTNNHIIKTLKIWTFISVATSILFQFKLDFIMFFELTYTHYESYVELIYFYPSVTTMDFLCLVVLAVSIISPIILITSNWNTNNIFFIIAISQVLTIILFFCRAISPYEYNSEYGSYELHVNFIFVLLATIVASILAFIGYKKTK